MKSRSMRQRIGADLDVYRARRGTFAGLHQPRRAVTVRSPQSPALPPGVRVVNPCVEALGKEAYRIRDAERDELAILERDEAVVQIRCRYRDVLAESDRVVLVYPGVIARLGAVLAQAVETRTGVFVH